MNYNLHRVTRSGQKVALKVIFEQPSVANGDEGLRNKMFLNGMVNFLKRSFCDAVNIICLALVA